jgi:hypothetical protein
VKRYDLVQVNACYTTDHEMEPSEDGEWVRYEDIHEAAMSLVLKWRQKFPVASLMCADDYYAGQANGTLKCSDQLEAAIVMLEPTK